MDRITLEMKTVEEAVESALKMLNARREDVEIIIEEEPSKGFLGIGSKDAKVTVVIKDSPAREDVLKEVEESKSNFEIKVEELKTEAKEFISESKETFAEIKEDAQEKFNDIKDDVSEFVDSKFNNSKKTRLLEGATHYKTEDEMIEATKQYLEKIIDLLGFEGHVEVIDEREQEENVVLDIVLDDYEQNSRVIGKKGDTINAIGYLIAQFVRGRYDDKMIIEVDCGDYIYDQKERLKAFARNAADRAIREGTYKLRPMNAYDRRIVHKALSDMEGVSTHSEGEEPRRSIVIKRDPQ